MRSGHRPCALAALALLAGFGAATAQSVPQPWVPEVVGPQYFAVLVEDVERAVAWYRTALGLEVVGGSEAEDGNIIQLSSPDGGGRTGEHAMAEAGGSERLDTIETENGRIAVSDADGAGPPVVFLHSLGGRHTQWSAQLERLRPVRRAVALDFPGHGDSEPARDGDHSLERMTRTVAEVVDSLGLGRFVLVGHSFGGGVAMRYAGAHPDRVAGLLLVDPVGDQRKVAAEIEAFARRLRTEDYDRLILAYWDSILEGAEPAVRDAVLADLRAARREAVIDAFASMATFDAPATLAPYDGPLLMVRTPLNDYPISLQHVLPGLRELVVKGTSHWLQMDRPAEFDEVLEGFLADAEAGRS